MFGEDYAYAGGADTCSGDRTSESGSDRQLLACQDEQQCLQILTEKGWEMVILQPVRMPFFLGREKRSGRSWIRW